MRLLGAIPEAYDRVVEAAIGHAVDFVVIAGDIFDNARASYGDYLHFFEGLRRLDHAGIPVYLCTGNHDPFTSWQHDLFAFPKNTTMFAADKPSFAVYERDGEPLCLLGGRGYYNQTWPADEDISAGLSRAGAEGELAAIVPAASHVPFSVGVLHTGLDLDPAKAPTSPAELMRRGMDYWALGHIHMKYYYPSIDDPRIVFSGCVQGRDIKETGERGCYLVTLTKGARNEIEFIPTASVVWQRMDVDISECATISDATDKIMRELFRVNGKARCEEMCVRITLRGTTPLHTVLARPNMIDDLRKQINDSYPSFFCDALIDATLQPYDKEALRREGLFPAVFLQVVDAMRRDRDDDVAYIQEEFLKKNLQLPGEYAHDVESLVDDAENLVLDLLQGGDEW